MAREIKSVTEQLHSEAETVARLIQLSRSEEGAWIGSTRPFGGPTTFYLYPCISKIPDYFVEICQHRGVYVNGERKSFTKAQIIREQNRGFNADR